jgi:hypothetical protein
MTAIVIAVAGIAFIVVVAIVVGIVDALQAPAWRRIAAERHENWERRRLSHHGPPRSELWDE